MLRTRLVSCGDTPERLESAEEALDEGAVFIQVPIIDTLSQTMIAWWNHRLCAPSFNGVDERIGIVALVGDDALRLNPLMRAAASVMSATCPPVRRTRKGLPKASTAA